MKALRREDAVVGLREAQERAENLLLSILPASIAERLKSSPQTIADQFTDTSVLFVDVVDFTPRSNGLTAAEVVGMLDRLFGEFDALAERYDLEKIKTIGNSYMVASGVAEPRPDHARVLALLALDMVAATRAGSAVSDLGLELRIGINSGPVVARVIGRKRFLYDLWGDTVNTASRMEAYLAAGQPLEALQAVRDGFAAVERTEERFCEAELHRLHGEALLAGHEDVAGASKAFRKGVDVATLQGANLFALRSAVRLAPLDAGRNGTREILELARAGLPAATGLGEASAADALLASSPEHS